MRDSIIAVASVMALVVASVGLGSLAFAGHHQVFVSEAAAAQR